MNFIERQDDIRLLLAKYLSLALATFIILVGFSVIMDKHDGVQLLQEIDPNNPIMTHNVAVNFVLIGLGVYALIYRFYHVSQFISFIVGSITVLLLLQEVFSINFYIDEFFYRYLHKGNAPYSGRTPPNFSACAMITSAALFFMACPKLRHSCVAIGGALGVLVLSLSTLFLIGHLIDFQPAYQWGVAEPMSLHIALGSVVLALMILSATYYQKILYHLAPRRSFSYLSAFCIFVAGLFLLGSIFEYQQLEEISSNIPMIAFLLTTLFAILWGTLFRYTQIASSQSLMMNQLMGFVSEQKRLEELLTYQSTHDLLTQLPNRVSLLELVDQSITVAQQNQQMFAVLLLDVDRFSIINNIFGRSKGDECLKLVSTRLQNVLPDGYIMGRIGGDELLIISDYLQQADEVTPIIKNLIDTLIEPFDFYNHQLTISCSIGVAIYPKDGIAVDELLGRSDIAMSQVKKTGRNGYQFYTTEMYAYTLDYLQVSHQLRSALDNDEFLLYYQPIFNIQSGSLVGVEALIRWENPLRGLLSPQYFIPLAEEVGLIREIDEWVIMTASQQVKDWHDDGYPNLQVSVNVSTAQFKYGVLAQTVARVLETTNILPHTLELELTEGMLIDDSKDVQTVLTELKKMNISIAIDDFGTGYSCLSYLKRFDINKLKIDRSFITHLPKNKEDEILVKAMIDMAKSFKMCVLAEGIETEEQLERLKMLGCDLGQGYYFAKPMPAEQFRKFLGHTNKG